MTAVLDKASCMWMSGIMNEQTLFGGCNGMRSGYPGSTFLFLSFAVCFFPPLGLVLWACEFDTPQPRGRF